MLLLIILFLPPALCSQILSSKISTNGGKFCWTGVCFGNVTKDFTKKPKKVSNGTQLSSKRFQKL